MTPQATSQGPVGVGVMDTTDPGGSGPQTADSWVKDSQGGPQPVNQVDNPGDNGAYSGYGLSPEVTRRYAMATPSEIRSLLAVPCDWCHAAIDEPCYTTLGRGDRATKIPVTTLDGGSHEARWHRAVGTNAEVLVQALAETQGRDTLDHQGDLVGASDRPW